MTIDHPNEGSRCRREPEQGRGAGRSAVDVLSTEHDGLRVLFERVSSPDEDRPAVLKELLQTLANHMAMEKQVLVPVLKEKIVGGSQLAERMTDEHDRVEHTLTLLERRKVNSPDVPNW
jgi:iron-sulfur cluster repair protein YtfE (RIC family)